MTNYNDERFTRLEADRQAALAEVDRTYSAMIGASDRYYEDQIAASQAWADRQTQLRQEEADRAVQQVEQQKAEAGRDYRQEQSGAYVDWQKQSNRYGANAEQTAAQGMANSGYSESSQVSMYNTYQNRVAAAREVYTQAVTDYDNAIAEARLQNSSALAEIAYEALQAQLELSLEGFRYKNTLLGEQADKKQAVEDSYYGRYQDVLSQINAEQALAEEIRRYNQSLAEEQRQFDVTAAEEQRQFDETLAEDRRQFDETLAEDQRQFGQELAEDQRQFDTEHAPIPAYRQDLEELGFGGINPARVAQLVEDRILIEYWQNGELRYRRGPGKKQLTEKPKLAGSAAVQEVFR